VGEGVSQEREREKEKEREREREREGLKYPSMRLAMI
jgi:hypothetical protein